MEYPLHDQTITVTQCGRLCFGGRKINLSAVFAGHNVGVREVADHVWLISFMHYDLGFFDDQCCRVECAPNPEWTKARWRARREKLQTRCSISLPTGMLI